MKVYRKLVRDHIPQMIEATGGKAVTQILSDEAYATYLEAKLDEEVGEYHKDRSVEELADILEVVYALAATIGCTPAQLEHICMEKRQQRGGFDQKIFLISVE